MIIVTMNLINITRKYSHVSFKKLNYNSMKTIETKRFRQLNTIKRKMMSGLLMDRHMTEGTQSQGNGLKICPMMSKGNPSN